MENTFILNTINDKDTKGNPIANPVVVKVSGAEINNAEEQAKLLAEFIFCNLPCAITEVFETEYNKLNGREII